MYSVRVWAINSLHIKCGEDLSDGGSNRMHSGFQNIKCSAHNGTQIARHDFACVCPKLCEEHIATELRKCTLLGRQPR